MKTLIKTIYTYAVLNTHDDDFSFEVTTLAGMEGSGWLLVDKKDISIEVDDVDYSALIKQKRLDAALAEQELIAAEILELTS